MKNISFSIFLLSVASILCLFPLSISPVHSQTGGGLEITPTVQWSENLAGTFSYCVYEGSVTLDSTNDPQAFCVIPTSDLPFQNMQAAENDVHILGVSSLAAGHKVLVPETIQALKDLGRSDIGVVAGGIIPEHDHDYLFDEGVVAIFGPGTIIADAAIKLLEILSSRLR